MLPPHSTGRDGDRGVKIALQVVGFHKSDSMGNFCTEYTADKGSARVATSNLTRFLVSGFMKVRPDCT